MSSVAWKTIRMMRWFGASVVFICYRRNDCADITGRLYDRLVLRFGRKRVIKDVNAIPLGVDFRDYVERAVPNCKVFLCIIGPNWLSELLDDPNDMVRLELTSALKSDIRVIPILVGGAKMPPRESLPEPIRALANRQGIEVRGDPDFHRDVERLITDL